MELFNRIFTQLNTNRDKILQGKVNCIPSPLPRFSDDFNGFEQGKYYVLTANAKVGKTQLTNYLLFSALLYAFYNPKKIRLKIFYFNLEESEEVIALRFISYLLYVFSNRSTRLGEKELMSLNNKALDPQIIEVLNQSPYKEILDFFEKTIEFRTERHPTGIVNTCEQYLRSHGKIIYKKQPITDKESHEVKMVDAFDYYIPDDPDEYVMGVVDHISLTNPESSLTLKQSIDLLSARFVKLRNNYKFIPIVVHQQAADQESVENFKLSKLKPSAMGLADSKYTGRDCNMMLGLFSPARHDLREYMKYDITLFRDNIRFLEVVLNRNGASNSICPLYFDGKISYFEELPLPQYIEGLQPFYDLIKQNRTTTTLLTLKLKKSKLWEKLLAFLVIQAKVKPRQSSSIQMAQ